MTPQSCLHQLRAWWTTAKESILCFCGLWLGFCVFVTASSGVPTNLPFKGLLHRDASPKPTISGGSPNANNPAKFRQGFLPLLDPAVISVLITQIKGKGCLRFLWRGWSTGQSCPEQHTQLYWSLIPTAGTLQECLEPTPESNRTKDHHMHPGLSTHREFFPIPLSCLQ